ncbi:unnamed protein product [Paramecium octaurelia]|uniref:H-type lectin domain-containing protein n=1 Tax=Paramecium octaurelia TaxID=43137 RepID=A0A8S1YP59_PAROT|nr:unnamed protein product [Paramecium octaurelia]
MYSQSLKNNEYICFQFNFLFRVLQNIQFDIITFFSFLLKNIFNNFEYFCLIFKVLKTLKLLLLILPQISGIIFDQGLCQETCQTNFVCKNQIQYTFTIAFNSPFDNVPQVFLVLDHIGVYVKTDFRMWIDNVTKQNFNLFVVCLTGHAHCVRIKWYAIDDQRFQIVNAFNTINLTQKKFQHKNKNVNTEIALISLISHNFDEINFKLQFDEITSDDVTVSLIKVPADFSKQVQVGFQIILGPKEAFQKFSSIIDSTEDYLKHIEEVQNAWFLSLFTGMGYPYTDAVRLDQQWQTAFTPCSHSHGYLSHNISTMFYSLNLIYFQVIQKSQLSSATQISIYFLDNNQVLNIVGEYNVTLAQGLEKVTIDITVVCPQGKIIESNFKKCYDCSLQQLYKSNYQCSNTLKELVFKTYYVKQTPAYSELLIKIQENFYEMKQILYNQKIEEALIFSINLQAI